MKNLIAAEVFPRGEFLREELEARGWTQADLAKILGRPQHLISEIIDGKRAVTAEVARGLGEPQWILAIQPSDEIGSRITPQTRHRFHLLDGRAHRLSEGRSLDCLQLVRWLRQIN